MTILSNVPINKRPPLKKLDHVTNILKNVLKVKMLETYADQLGYTKNPDTIKKAITWVIMVISFPSSKGNDR